ncbi:MAG: acyl carrier protein [Clostridia bacterium]|nr:acyl carrier protein [Clostridia bacterium]
MRLGGFSLFEKIKNIICEQFAVDEDYVTPDTNLVEDLGADSLDMVDLAMTLEDEFLQEVSDETLKSFETVSDIIDFYD